MNFKIATNTSLLALLLIAVGASGCVYEYTVEGSENDEEETLNVEEQDDNDSNDSSNDEEQNGAEQNDGEQNDSNNDNTVGDAELSVTPLSVEFAQLAVGLSDWTIVEIDNVGDEPAEIDDIYIRDGGDDFSLSFVDGDTSETDADTDMAPTTLAPEDEPIEMRVSFSPGDINPVDGQLAVLSDVFSDGEEIVELSGNDDGLACLDVVTGDTLDFGTATLQSSTSRMIVVSNCSSTADLELSDVSVIDDAGGVFAVDETSLPDGLSDGSHIVEAGETTSFFVDYTPATAQIDEGLLSIGSDDLLASQFEVSLVGEGADGACPIAEATGSIGTSAPDTFLEADNQDVIELSALNSYDPDGTELTYQWSVVSSPVGSTATLEPGPDVAEPEFEVDLVGNYTLELVVYDQFGIASCDPATVEIQTTPPGEIHLQLVWTSPTVEEDYDGPDSGSGIGTDLDIHYKRHDMQWGDTDTVFWSNVSQDWGEDGDVTLDIDSLYGTDPENINHTQPASGGQYQVGAHYYCDKGYDDSHATVRIYFGDTLISEQQQTLSETDHFWHVGDIHWGDDPYVDTVDDYFSSFDKLNDCSGF